MTPRGGSTLDRLVADALAHHAAGRHAEAAVACRAALAEPPGHPVVMHNLGAVLAAHGDHANAIACFDHALASEPHYASAHYNRGLALGAAGRDDEARQALARACACDPGHYDAHRAMGFAWLAAGNRGRALDHFARTLELRRGEDRAGLAARSLTTATRSKLRHDAEQFRYLAARRRDRLRFELLARAYDEAAAAMPDAGSATLTPAQLDLLGEDFNTGLVVTGGHEVRSASIDPHLDGAHVADRFRDERGVVVLDDLLTPGALAGLWQFLNESTIWHDFDHIGGFVASYLEDGLACPLVLQIADELRARLPDVLGPHPLTQAWAFKGLEHTSTVEAHADDAAVSVNLWLTPDAANLAPGASGLAVCRAEPPADWHIRGYENDKARVQAFIDSHPADTLHVPYRRNRAILFRSHLCHASDAPAFGTAYDQHRINLTLLYGRDQP